MIIITVVLFFSAIQQAIASEVFYKDVGVLFEKNNIILGHNGFIIDSISIMMPSGFTITSYYPNTCNDSSYYQNTIIDMTSKYDHMMHGLKQIIPVTDKAILQTKYNSKRVKRLIAEALTLTVAGSALALGLSNMYRIGALESKIDEVYENVQKMKDIMVQNTNKTNEIIDKWNKLEGVVIPSIIEHLSNVSYSVKCQERTNLAMSVMVSEIISYIPSKMMRIYDSALSGKIIPEMMTYENILTKIKSRDDIQSTFYSDDPSLIYTLGSFVLVSVSHDPLAINGLILLPKLLRETIGVVFNVNTVPFYHREVYQQLSIPDIISVDKEGKIWELSNRCVERSRLYLCPIHAANKHPVVCLQNIHNGSLESCTSTTTSTNTKICIQTYNGLLCGAGITRIQYLNRTTDRQLRVAKETGPYRTPIYIKNTDADEVIIDDRPYTLYNDYVTTDIKVESVNISNSTTADYIDGFTPDYISKLTDIDFILSHNNHANWWPSILPVLLVTCALVFWGYYKLLKRINRLEIMMLEVDSTHVHKIHRSN